MNSLIDRMITRVQRPISPVEPLLTRPYVLRPNMPFDSEVNATPASESRHETHFHSDSNQPTISWLQLQKTQDTTNPRSSRQSSEQRPANAPGRDDFSDHLISEARTSTLPLPKIEPSPSLEELYERDSPHTETHRLTQRTQAQEIDGKEHSKLVSTRLATQPTQNDPTKRAERNVGQSNTQNLQPAPTTEIHISIGHIEVRAIQRSEPARRSVSPSHVTLDDYLHRRPGASR